MNRAGGRRPTVDAVGGQSIQVDGSGVNRDIISVEKPPLLHQDRPLLLHVLYKDDQDLCNVCRFDGGPPRDDVSVDEALAAKDCQQHLFGQPGMDLGLY